MLYLDNAATSAFKPQSVYDSLMYDIRHSANSGRSGHRYALDAAVRIENCRSYLLNNLGADGYDIVFTKNCTEALNLAIFGLIKGGERVVTSQNEHNSVLRPLFELKRRGKIALDILPLKDGNVDLDELEHLKADVVVLGGASNVTGAVTDIRRAAKIARQKRAVFIMDGAQSVPICDLNMDEFGIDMLACPGHKGLHGIQGTGFLIKSKDIKLKPLLYGGTGTNSADEGQPPYAPEAYEAGTLFSGGISALYSGAKWSFDHLMQTRKNFFNLTETLLYNLKNIGCTLYTDSCVTGVVAFNVDGADSSYIAQMLGEEDIAVRGGLHCAPLVHKSLGTLSQGAVRVSLGVETSQNDIRAFCNTVERIAKKIRSRNAY